MFSLKREPRANMTLTLKMVLTFDQPFYMGKIFSDRVDKKATSITTTFPEFHSIEDINGYYPFIRETPGFSSAKLVLTLTGYLSGVDISETFDDIDTFDSFLLENNILPADAHKPGF